MSEAGKAVFLSYASQDTEAAKKLCEALRAAGVEVWFDQSELVGGDAWDQKIRRQIKDCALLIPIISAATQARTEGYFRLEWRLADQRTHLMAKGRPFLLPVVIDETRDAEAQVPDSFTEVQWTRLSRGEGAQKFAGRVKALLGGGASAGLSAAVAPSVPIIPESVPPRPAGKRWLVPVIAGAVVALLALVIARPWSKETRLPGSTPPAGLAPAGAAPLSPARQLAHRARAMNELPNPSRETLETAGQLVAQAKALDPTDADVWAVGAMTDAWVIFYTYDTSEARRERARSDSAHALALDPKSYEARLARAFVLFAVVAQPAVWPEAEALLQALIQENPDDHRALDIMGNLLRDSGRAGEAADLFKRAKSFNAAGWAYFSVQRYDEAAAVVDQALLTDRSAANLELKAVIEVYGREDLDAAQAAIDQLPASALLEDRTASSAVTVRRMRREPEKMLEILRAIPRDWLSSQDYVGPKAALTGEAYAMAKRPQAAQTDWRLALQQVEQRLATDGNAPRLLLQKAGLLASLGELAAAEHALDLERQLSGVAVVSLNQDLLRDRVAMLLGRRDEAVLNRIEAVLKDPSHNPFMHAIVRFAPMYDSLRGVPRFEQLLRDTLPKGAKPFDDAQGRPFPESKSKTPNPGPSSPLAVDSKSVAVLAFTNLSDDKANEYFSDGISEELLNVLAKVPGLKVTARTSSFHFKGKDTPISEIAQQLGVAYVVEGSVRKSGDKVRITAQLIKAADGFHVWSDTFTRELKDVFAVQDEIAGLIAKNLELKLDIAAKAAVKVDPEAYRLYLEGRQILQRRTLESYTQAEKLFTEARVLAPEWAPVYAGLADAARLRAFGTQGPSGPDSPWLPDMKTAKTLADRALELDPSLAEAYVSLGGTAMLAWNFSEAERLIRRALELNPNQADAYLVLGRVMSAEGRMDESITALRRAVDLNPLAPRILDNLAAELGFTGRYAEAWEIIERANALQPDSSQIQCYRVRLLADMGRREEALALARRMVDNSNPEEREFRLIEAARAFALFGQKAEAAAAAAQVPADVGEYVIVQAYLGVPEKAVPLLGRLSFGWIEDLLWGSGFDPIRHDPGYIAYLARTGLTEANARAQAWRAAHPPEKPAAGEQRTGDRGPSSAKATDGTQGTGKTAGGGP